MDIPIYSNSLRLNLEEIEKHLYDNLMLRIPNDTATDPDTRREKIFKVVHGLERSCTLELLPTILLLLEDPKAYAPILDLLKSLVAVEPEETLAIIASSAQKDRIKKQCLHCLKELLEITKIQPSHKVMFSLAGVLNDTDKEAAALAREIGRKIRDTIFRAVPPKNEEKPGLIYGIFPKALFSDFYESGDKKIKLSAVKSIEEIVCNMPDPSFLADYQLELIHFLTELLNDTMRGFVNSGFRMLVHLSKSEQININKLIPIVRTYLGDSSINVRKASFTILLHSLKRQENLAVDLLPGLDNENWHIREETINLFLGGMLSGLDFKSLDLPHRLAKLLDDEKSKVRHLTIETFAVIAKIQGREHIETILKPLVDALAFKNISDRFEIPVIASLANDAIQIPRILPSSAPTMSSSRPHKLLLHPISQNLDPLSMDNFSIPASTITQDFGSKIFNSPTSTQDFSSKIFNIPSPMMTQEFNSTISRGPRSSSLNCKIIDSHSPMILKQSSDFIKPPLPSKQNARRLPKIKVEDRNTTEVMGVTSTFIDKSYIEWTKLEPIDNPQEELNKFMSSTDTNWEVQFEFTSILRKLNKYHKSLLNAQNIHRILLELLKWGDSLRSSLSKSSLLALGEFCREIPKLLDQDIESILNLLLRKSVDTNLFISDAGMDSLVLCVTHCSLSRLIPSILANAAQAKSGLLKSRVAYCTKFVINK